MTEKYRNEFLAAARRYLFGLATASAALTSVQM